ncbi:GDSL family lipase [Roseivivax halodurans JCM 10272]|uniref:GDSL family lipase n=1 Tax=Roseivivax halodurans JCM 10272 TaxID=1449350 RepID=X7EJ49_9RHOB|nr:arylesterase [Roseivivax halodurans]ETX15201.1 GDSL family lipase [Roseivivax halodurans JCM 10272]
MRNATGYGVAGRLSKAVLVLAVLAGTARAEPLELVALGDSLTQGYGLMEEDGFVPQLEAWLTERGHDVDVINAGVSGDTTAGGLSRAEWSLNDETDAMIVALGGNDLLRGIDPAVSKENLSGILDVAAAEGLPVLLAGLPAPGNFGAEFKREFDAMYPDLAEAYGVSLYPNFLAGLADGGDTPARMTRFMQSDGIHPNAEGVARIVADIGPMVEELLREASGGTGAEPGSN